ncbi:peptidoglycan DD-metalloendopeptidase family protein [Nocardioides sp. Leaf285]|uniref:peptidoglycan DD-metalloendopeptidase family protein n=1 Tax=Nocardioides sp. Leaf285 TaxID=1736322 RepID=UPI000702B2A2|nr:peptidoglycan DD-metalloendopeptidase family protein [Nocardioides sp. Leaf285]KQP62872.1 hypothetical protein ASF47_17825 [Nocardioides sp. Leaf285]
MPNADPASGEPSPARPNQGAPANQPRTPFSGRFEAPAETETGGSSSKGFAHAFTTDKPRNPGGRRDASQPGRFANAFDKALATGAAAASAGSGQGSAAGSAAGSDAPGTGSAGKPAFGAASAAARARAAHAQEATPQGARQQTKDASPFSGAFRLGGARGSGEDGKATVKDDVARTAEAAKQGASIGTKVGGPAGTAVGAAIGGVVGMAGSKRGRVLLALGLLTGPLGVAAAITLVLVIVVAAIGGGFAGNQQSSAAVGVAAATEDGLTQDQTAMAMNIAAVYNVPWEILAAVPFHLDVDPTGPAQSFTTAARSKAIEGDEPVGAMGLAFDPTQDYVDSTGTTPIDFEGMTNPVTSMTWVARALSNEMTGRDASDVTLDAGTVSTADREDIAAYDIELGTSDADKEEAEDAKEHFTDALSSLPFAEAETLAPVVYDIALTWHLGGRDECDTGASAASAPSSVAGIPQVALDAYVSAAEKTGVAWYYLAGIGFVETQHGTYAGSAPDTEGNVVPKIIGIRLDGSNNTAVIRDTDNGALDGDTSYDRAVGPMQFIPSTWATMSADGNLDGESDPHNIWDTALAAAQYLNASGAAKDISGAIRAYNHSDAYVAAVLEKAEEYKAAPAAPTSGASAQPASANAPAPTADAAAGGQQGAGDDSGDDSDSANGGWTQPLQPGTYTLTARFGEKSSYWTSFAVGHSGLDYAAPAGTQVFAVNAGTVTRLGDGGSYGSNYMEITHGTVDGKQIVSRYAHMQTALVSQGDTVDSGQLIGEVGSEGNSTGPHLHLEITVGPPLANGDPNFVDPETFLANAGVPQATAGEDCVPTSGDQNFETGPDGAWGGFSNGKIPASALQQLSFSPALLRPDAAAALEALNTEYKAEFGCDIGPVGGYRSYEEQVALYAQKPGLAATPGTSNHGWGLAVDLSGNCNGNGGINIFGTPANDWMQANAGEYGWLFPSWAVRGGGREEPWHWQFAVVE